MKSVRARLDSQIDDGPAERAIFRVRIARFHLEGIDRIERRSDADESVQRLGVVNAIYHLVVTGPRDPLTTAWVGVRAPAAEGFSAKSLQPA